MQLINSKSEQPEVISPEFLDISDDDAILEILPPIKRHNSGYQENRRTDALLFILRFYKFFTPNDETFKQCIR